MRSVIRRNVGTVSCPTMGSIERRFNRCEFIVCYCFERPRELFPNTPGQDRVNGMVPDWVELHFLDASMEKDRLRIVTTREAQRVYEAYLSTPQSRPRIGINAIMKIVDHPVYAVIDSDTNAIVTIFDTEDVLKAEAKMRNDDEGLYRDRYVVREVSTVGAP